MTLRAAAVTMRAGTLTVWATGTFGSVLGVKAKESYGGNN
jgi:hypothetical protein